MARKCHFPKCEYVLGTIKNVINDNSPAEHFIKTCTLLYHLSPGVFHQGPTGGKNFNKLKCDSNEVIITSRNNTLKYQYDVRYSKGA